MISLHLPFPSCLNPIFQSSTYAMAHKDHLPLVFQFGEVDSEPEEIENKEEWDLRDMALNELAAADAAPRLSQLPSPRPRQRPSPWH